MEARRHLGLAVWKIRLAHRRRIRNYWLRRVERHEPGRIHNAKKLAEWQDKVGQAFAEVEKRQRADHRPVTMYDAVTVANVPVDCKAFAGYVAGNQWPNNWRELSERFPHAKSVTITLTASVDADILDVEKGGALPSEVVGWCNRQWARGVARPGVYASLSVWSVIDGHLRNQGWSRRRRKRIRRWQAHYDGVREIPKGFDGKQYQTGAYDVSVVRWDFFS